MLQMFLLALLLQGPKTLQIDESVKIKPPLVVPKGTAIPVALVNSLSTKTAKDGDSVYARVVFPVTVDDEIVIPVNAHIKGTVTDVDRPGRVKGKGELTLSFQSLILPSGHTVPLFGSLGSVGAAGTRKGENTIEGESSKGEDAGKVATGGAGGAIGGVISGRSAKRAGAGAGVGAAAGAVAVLLTRGKDLVLQPGTTMEVVLDSPLEP
jgi:hypothetical protein